MGESQEHRVALIAPLQEELDAILKALDHTPEFIKSAPFDYFKSTIDSEHGHQIQIYIFHQLSLGEAHAASLASYVLLNFDVSTLVIAGLCGALIPNELSSGGGMALGDVVFANRIIDADIRKVTGDRIELRDYTWHTSSEYCRIGDELIEEIKNRSYSTSSKKGAAWFHASNFSMHSGSIVSVDSVLADRALRDKLSEFVTPSALAVEMEAHGVLTAAAIFKNSDMVAMIRAVADFADERKDDSARDLACRNFAHVTLEFVRRLSKPGARS